MLGWLKEEFKSSLIVTESNSNAFESIFKIAIPFEKEFKKELHEFSSKEIYTMFESIANTVKFKTLQVYNSLISTYMTFAKDKGFVVGGVCSVASLRYLSESTVQYVILSKRDIEDLTVNFIPDGADFNAWLFIWTMIETNGQVDSQDILNLKLSDIKEDSDGHYILFKNRHFSRINKFYVSNDLIFNIIDFAEQSELECVGKKGSYRILTAEENDGFIFRKMKTKRTKVGESITNKSFTNILHNFCKRNLPYIINQSDILMSLAVRDMINNNKDYSEISRSGKYFKSVDEKIYKLALDNAIRRLKNGEEF